jgi:hypothetical protein
MRSNFGPMVIVAGVLALACKENTPAPAAEAPVVSQTVAQAPVAMPVSAPASAADAPAFGSLTGSVVETMDAGGYTYLKLKTSNGEVWAAVQKASVAKGSTVTVANAMPMQNFESKTLKRSFEQIYFGTLAGPAVAAEAPAPADLAAAHAGAASGPADVGEIKVAKAEGPEGRTVAEVFAQRAALKDKVVTIRGKVVKFLPGIMGRNWAHVRDGSGTRAGKDDDLTVTSADTVEVGAVVLVTGTVRNDKDFGSGYSYPVMVEDARFSK